VLKVFRTYYGPVLKTFASLKPPAWATLEHDLAGLIPGSTGRAAAR
jgi:hypothetical protein